MLPTVLFVSYLSLFGRLHRLFWKAKKQGNPFEDRCSHVEFRSDGHTHLLVALAAEPCVRGDWGRGHFTGASADAETTQCHSGSLPIVAVLGWDGLPDADLCLRRPVTPISAKNTPVISRLRLHKRLLPSTLHKSRCCRPPALSSHC